MAGTGYMCKRFSGIKNCSTNVDRAGHTVVASLNGTLLRSRSPFPYYMLLALEAGSPLRAFVLLLLCPFIWCTWHVLMNECLATQMLIFVSTAGLRLSEVAGVCQAVLPKFYFDDLHSQSFKVFKSCSERYVVTSNPRVMVEYFLKAHVGVNEVFGTELQVTRGGHCTGLVERPGGVMLGRSKAETVKKVFGDQAPDMGLGSGATDYPFLSLSKEAYLVGRGGGGEGGGVPRERPVVFHDGRLVMQPTPLAALSMFLWVPFGLMLAVMRITTALCLPMEVGFPCAALLGLSFRVKGAPPLPLPLPMDHKQGILFACSHRSLLDPTYMCVGLRRKVRALTYSVSRVSELISPIRTTCLTRDREEDGHLISELLERGEDLFVCPEGTTCREPYLLRFSSLFAELTEHIVPVAMRVRMSMFHGTTARGCKALDAFFFLMNPRPKYEIIFLHRLPKEHTVAGGRSSVEVAKMVQKQLADALGYKCTDFTRKDKYTLLAGHDGTVKDPRFSPKSSTSNCGNSVIHGSNRKGNLQDDTESK